MIESCQMAKRVHHGKFSLIIVRGPFETRSEVYPDKSTVFAFLIGSFHINQICAGTVPIITAFNLYRVAPRIINDKTEI